MRRRWLFSACLLLAIAVIVTACGKGGGGSASMPASVTVSISDPATCSHVSGGFLHVYVTVVDVQVHTNANASLNDSGWVDLTPNLKSAPQQIDLLAPPSSGCMLATLGAAQQIPAGTYQQIRLILADTGTTPTGTNACGGNVPNCVVPFNQPNSTFPLARSSEAKTGLKIPSGQIAGGRFVVGAGETKDLNLDFNTCSSIVKAGNSFRLKPVLHAGEASLVNSAAITGTLVDRNTGAPLRNALTMVALEQNDNGVDRVVMQTRADANGFFVLCPVPAGTYDVVATAIDSQNNSFAATITTGVTPATALGNIPMNPVTGTTTSTQTIQVKATGSGSSGATMIDVVLSALQQSGTQFYTIPLTESQSATFEGQTSACSGNTQCLNFDMKIAMGAPTIGAFSSGGTSYTFGATGSADYTVEGRAFQATSTTTPNCSPSTLTQLVHVVPGPPIVAPALDFVNCQP